MHITVMTTEYVKAINSQLSHGLDFEKKYIESTLNKMLKVELGAKSSRSRNHLLILKNAKNELR